MDRAVVGRWGAARVSVVEVWTVMDAGVLARRILLPPSRREEWDIETRAPSFAPCEEGRAGRNEDDLVRGSAGRKGAVGFIWERRRRRPPGRAAAGLRGTG